MDFFEAFIVRPNIKNKIPHSVCHAEHFLKISFDNDIHFDRLS